MLQMLQTRPALIVIHAGKMLMDIPHYPLECSLSSACMAFATGFEILKSHKSPKHPFSIFKTRFPTAPKMIIYDKCCKLHAYCLNRKPVFFQNTQFLVDRFHWRGHIGCSKGYFLDSYKKMDTRGINSQVNEQSQCGAKAVAEPADLHEASKLFFSCFLIFWPSRIETK